MIDLSDAILEEYFFRLTHAVLWGVIFVNVSQSWKLSRAMKKLQQERKEAVEIFQYYEKLVRHIQATHRQKRLIPVRKEKEND